MDTDPTDPAALPDTNAPRGTDGEAAGSNGEPAATAPPGGDPFGLTPPPNPVDPSRPGANVHGIGPDVAGGANPDYVPPMPLGTIGTEVEPWPSYVSHKVVQALPIVDVDIRTHDDGPSVIWVEPVAGAPRVEFAPTEPAMAAHAEVGGYAVAYADGFKSVSPKAAFEEGYRPLPAPAPEGDPPVRDLPLLGLQVHDLDENTVGIHAIEPDGTEHAITMPAAHGAWLAFKEMVLARLPELGSRATAYKVQKPGEEEPTQVVPVP